MHLLCNEKHLQCKLIIFTICFARCVYICERREGEKERRSQFWSHLDGFFFPFILIFSSSFLYLNLNFIGRWLVCCRNFKFSVEKISRQDFLTFKTINVIITAKMIEFHLLKWDITSSSISNISNKNNDDCKVIMPCHIGRFTISKKKGWLKFE